MKKFAAFLMIVSVSCFSLVGCTEPEDKATDKDETKVEKTDNGDPEPDPDPDPEPEAK